MSILLLVEMHYHYIEIVTLNDIFCILQNI